MVRIVACCRCYEHKTAYGGRGPLLLPLLASLLCWGLLPVSVSAISSAVSLQDQMISTQQPLHSVSQQSSSLPTITASFSVAAAEVTSSSSMFATANNELAPSARVMTEAHSASLSTAGGVSVTPSPTSALTSQTTMSTTLQPTVLSTTSSMSPSPSPVTATPTGMGGTTSNANPISDFFTEDVIFIFIIVSGAVMITILLIILMAALGCCWYVSYRRCKKRQEVQIIQQEDQVGRMTASSNVMHAQMDSKEALSQIEMASMTAFVRFDTSQGTCTQGSTQFLNGTPSASQGQPCRDTHLSSSFYPAIKGSATSSSLLLANPDTIGPTEDFRDLPPVENQTLTQESVNSRIVDHALPERSEFVHEDIKSQQEQREVAERGQEEGVTPQHQVESPMSPTQLQLPQKVTTLSKKQASMVDLSMITMIKNEYFEDLGSPLTDGGHRDRAATVATSSLDMQAHPERRKRSSALDLCALTALADSSRTQNDIQPLAEQASNDRPLIGRQPSRSMADLSYVGEVDIESDRDARKARSPKKSNRRTNLPRASSMLEDLTSINGSLSRNTVDTLAERSQEGDSNSPSEFSTVNRDPPLKSILKNSGSRQNLFTRSSLELHDAADYTPPLPRIPRPRHTHTTPLAVLPQLPIGASLTQDSHPIRHGSYNMPTTYGHFSIFNARLDPPPVMEDRRDRDEFWGRPVYSYYDPGVMAPRRERYMGY